MASECVFLDVASVDAGDLDRTSLDRATGNATRYFPTTAPGELAARLASAETVILNKILVDADFLAAAPHLKLLCAAATGTNNIDLNAARERGVAVCNIRGYCTDSVAQHVFALILSLSQRLDDYRQALRGGAWRDSPQFCLLDYPIPELAGKQLCIVGAGTLGEAVARLGSAFGLEVVFAARPGATDDPRPTLESLLPVADILSLHCPLTAATENLLDTQAFAAMKSTAIVINTARGGLIDSAALATALAARRIGGAGIDVLPQEPPVDGDPLLDPELPNLIVTPHIAWAAREARQRALDEIAANISAFHDGQPRNRIA